MPQGFMTHEKHACQAVFGIMYMLLMSPFRSAGPIFGFVNCGTVFFSLRHLSRNFVKP